MRCARGVSPRRRHQDVGSRAKEVVSFLEPQRRNVAEVINALEQQELRLTDSDFRLLVSHNFYRADLAMEADDHDINDLNRNRRRRSAFNHSLRKGPSLVVKQCASTLRTPGYRGHGYSHPLRISRAPRCDVCGALHVRILQPYTAVKRHGCHVRPPSNWEHGQNASTFRAPALCQVACACKQPDLAASRGEQTCLPA